MPSRAHKDSIPAHYLQRVVGCNVPSRIIAFSAASHTTDSGKNIEHELKCWSIMAVDRVTSGASPSIVTAAYGKTAQDFAQDFTASTVRRGTTYAYCYDAGYSSVILQLPQCLIDIGWTLERFNITSELVWFKLRMKDRIVFIADIQSVIPEKIQKLADFAQIALEPTPNDTVSSESDWQSYGWNRVQVVMVNALCCMDYCEENDIGSWATTGSSIGWNAYRHKFIQHDILITSEQEPRDFERLAIRGGRREVFQTAEWEDGFFADIDIRAAYPSIARAFDLPVKRGGHFDNIPDGWHQGRPKSQGIIARCIVETKAPLVPAQHGTTTFYGTGTFSTILASPEIDLLHASGAKVTILDGYRYKLAPIMQKWGEWITTTIHPNNIDVPPAVRAMVKHWSRATIGRWTMRYMREDSDFRGDPQGSPVERIGYLKFRDEDKFIRDGLPFVKSGAVPVKDIEGYLINIDGNPRAFFRDEEPRECFPAITAWIESICRVLLVKLMATQPVGQVMQCDTDGYLVKFSERDVLNMVRASFFAKPDVNSIWINGCDIPLPQPPEGFELVVKGRYTNVHIRGAQQLRLDGERRMAGVPVNAKELSPELLEAEVFPTYVEQLRHGKRGVFVSHNVTFTSKSTIATGWREKNGHIIPVEFTTTNGVNRILQPKWSYLTSASRRLAPHQHPILEQILNGS